MLSRNLNICRLIWLAILFAVLPAVAHAWPSSTDWNPLYKDSGYVDDPEKDSATSRDIVGDSTYPAAYLYNDGTYIYFRIRIDEDPRDNSLTGLDPFGWGFLIDTDGDTGDYEYMIMLDGITSPEEIYLAENTVKTNISNPSDKAETIVWSQLLNNDPISGNYQVLTPTDIGGPTSSFGGDDDYYLDYRMPYDVFKTTLGLTDDSLIRLFIGSSNSAQTLTADLGTTASSAYDGLLNDGISDEVLPNGELPATGALSFVADLSGSGDVTEFYPGSTLYIRVDDADQNGIPTLRETISITVTSPSGDSETLTLLETGVDTGAFTASVATSQAAPVSNDGTLQVSPIEFITATYIDAADSNLDVYEPRNDTAKALPAADLALSKSIDNPTPNEGENVTFTINLHNNGPSTATSIQVTDQLPAGLTYVSNSGSGSYNPTTGIWSIASLATGNTLSLQIIVTVDGGTSLTTITNSAAITAHAQPDPVAGNDTASASLAVTGADLALSMTVDTFTPNSGGTVVLTLELVNNGSFDASSISITELLDPTDLGYVSHVAGAGSYDPGTGTWTLAGLTSGDSTTLEITATVNAASNTTITQTASITSLDQSDPATANNTATTTLYVDGTDLRLTKSVSDPTPDVGDTVTYTLLLENLGTNSASGIQVSDLLPAGVTYQSSTAPPGTTYTSATGLWDFSATSLAGGSSASLSIDVTIDAGTAAQTISNTASILASPLDSDPGNDSSSVDIAIRYIDLAISKSVDNTTPQDNETIIFTIDVTNNGLIDADSVVIFDQLPGQLDYVSSSATQGSYSETTHLWTLGTVAVGGTETLTITCNVDIGQNDAPTFFNFASLQSADQEDPVDGNNSDSVLIGVAGTDISVAKSVDNSNPSTGDTITYTLLVTNNGPNTATNLKVSEVLPAGLTLASSSFDYGSNTGYSSGVWTIGDKSGGDTVLPAYTTVTLTVTATVTATSGTTLVNTAFIQSLDEAETDSTNNASQVTIIVGGADLALSMAIDDTTPTVDETVTYILTLTNNGPDDTDTVQVTDLLPGGLTLVSATPETGTSYDSVSGLWDVGLLATGASLSLQLSATVDSGTGGTTITHSASVTNSNVPDPVSANNSASVSTVIQEADVVLTKTADHTTPEEGTPVVFTITLFNNGPTDTTGLQVSDLLPAGLTYSSHVAEAGSSYDQTTGLWDLSGLTLAKSASATLTVTATVDFGTEGTNITNTASILSADAHDPNTGNNSEDAIITPAAGIPATLTIMKMSSTASAKPGDIVTYTITILNSGPGVATDVVIDDLMPSTFVALQVDPYGNGTPFQFTDGVPASSLTPTVAIYEDNSSTPITLTDGGGGSPGGSDGRVAHWSLPFTGIMPNSSTFTLNYQVIIK
ncbi:MAG: hypothetical protein C0624_04090 [Desulfuromonas sp.]|nr:MAG: hypothetical protein C0624_04090 [Desulfuromonas sp.]